MSNTIIQVTNLSKSYSISHEGRESYTSLRDVIARKTKKIFSFPRSFSCSMGGSRREAEEFRAPKEINPEELFAVRSKAVKKYYLYSSIN